MAANIDKDHNWESQLFLNIFGTEQDQKEQPAFRSGMRQEDKLVEQIAVHISHDDGDQKISEFFKYALDLLCLVGTDGYYKRVSNSFESHFGYAKGELLNQPMMNYIFSEDLKETLFMLEKAGQGCPCRNFENRHIHKNGAMHWLSWTCVQIPNTELILATARDITNNKENEDLLRVYTSMLQSFRNTMDDSVEYARALYESLVTTKDELKSVFSDSFLMNIPMQDISGDFFWMGQQNGKIIIAVGDCTGHGVSGAVVAGIGLTTLQKAVYVEKETSPARIMAALDSTFQRSITTNSSHTEMNRSEIAICSIDKENKTVSFATTGNPICLIRNSNLIEYMSYPSPADISLITYVEDSFDLLANDCLYLFTDGFADQFGGIRDQKYSINRLKHLLTDLSKNPMEEQHSHLITSFFEWKRANDQIDDVIVVGMRL